MNSSISRILLDSGAFHFKISHQNYLISLNTHLWQKNKKKKYFLVPPRLNSQAPERSRDRSCTKGEGGVRSLRKLDERIFAPF